MNIETTRNIERRNKQKSEIEPYRFLGLQEPNQQALYDTLQLKGFQSPHSSQMMFSHPIGTQPQGKTKTLLDTNMWSGSVLEMPWSFFFKNLSAVFVKEGTVLPVRNTWYRGTYAQFLVNGKIYLKSHLDRCADRCALFADDESRRDAVERGIWKLLEPMPWVPCLISPQESFGVQLEFSNLLDWENAPDAVVIYLDGVLFRAIQ